MKTAGKDKSSPALEWVCSERCGYFCPLPLQAAQSPFPNVPPQPPETARFVAHWPQPLPLHFWHTPEPLQTVHCATISPPR
jgi:hypothetical protein